MLQLMSVKQLIQLLRNPPNDRIIAIRIEFADGSICQDSPDTRPDFGFDSTEDGNELLEEASHL